MPILKVDFSKLEHNILLAKKLQAYWGVHFLPVMKMVNSHQTISEFFHAHDFNLLGIADLGESKQNLLPAEQVYINLAPVHKAKEIVTHFFRSSFSSLASAIALNNAAKEKNIIHSVLLMIDIGDMREGVPIEQVESLAYALRSANLSHLNFQGIGANFGCLEGVHPNWENFGQLKNIHQQLENILRCSLPVVSLGGSVCFDWLFENHSNLNWQNIQLEFRTGDVFFLGTNMYTNQPLACSDFKQRIFELEAEVLEVYEKSMPIKIEKNLLNHKESFPLYSGIRKRILIDCGYLHTDMSHVTLEEKGVEVVGVCGNYAVLDVTESAKDWQVGDSFSLCPHYWAVASSFRNTSIEKVFL